MPEFRGRRGESTHRKIHGESQEEGFIDLSADAFTHLFNQTLLGSF